ncbi:hypothetical protein V492_00621 [Pseudogymnoascus sp. VKM F-4246]|nr:hypothetical protein V492_00621 [Pseudogymnoascus sp. VKM F-4246]
MNTPQDPHTGDDIELSTTDPGGITHTVQPSSTGPGAITQTAYAPSRATLPSISPHRETARVTAIYTETPPPSPTDSGNAPEGISRVTLIATNRPPPSPPGRELPSDNFAAYLVAEYVKLTLIARAKRARRMDGHLRRVAAWCSGREARDAQAAEDAAVAMRNRRARRARRLCSLGTNGKYILPFADISAGNYRYMEPTGANTLPAVNMAKIKTVEYFRLPPRWLFVKIVDEDGNAGWGEASLEGHTQAVEGCLDAYRSSDIEHIWQLLYRFGFYRGGPVLMSALSGIDIALWDLKARKFNVPIYQLLGGKLRDTIKVYAWIGGDRPGDVELQAKARKAQGFTAVKMNATEDLGWMDSPSALASCVERVKAVKALGLDAGVDFHGRVHKPMAKQLARLLEPHQPMFLEEPLLSENMEGIKEISRLTTAPIALGERLHSRWDFKRFLEAGAVDIAQPDISHCGGISEMRRIATMCEAYDVALAPHCPLGPIALAANIQVDAVSANFAIQEMSLGIHYNAGSQDLSSYTTNPEVWDVKEGYIGLLQGPGLGIEIDEEMVRRLSVGAEAWVSPGFVGPGGEVREW